MKLKAFTIIEILVSMVITSVVIYLCYLSLLNFKEEISIIRKSDQKILETKKAIGLLSNDLDLNNSITISPDHLKIMNENIFKADYEFGDNNLIRINKVLTDTFLCRVNFNYENLLQNNPPFLERKFTWSFMNDTMSYSFVNLVSAAAILSKDSSILKLEEL